MPGDDETVFTTYDSLDQPLVPGQTLSPMASGSAAGGARPTEGETLDPADTSTSTVLGRVRGERYTVISVLGRGGMGEVYRVHDALLDRSVALKVVRGDPAPHRLQRFEAEARLTARLQHPGIVPVHDFGLLPDGRLFFTMREIEGRTFGEEIERLHHAEDATFRPRLRRLVDAFRRACEAIAYAHDAGVLHRDLKPDNLMVGPFGEVMVLDWGVGIHLEQGGGRLPGVAGTPDFMAPEQARGEPLSPAADVWALGMCLHTILAGRPPRYPASEHTPPIQAIGLGLRPDLSLPDGRTLPVELIDLRDACLVRAPGDRPPDAGVLVSELTEWLDGSRRRERALARVAEADRALARSRDLAGSAAQHQARAEALLAALPATAPVSEREASWDLEDRARELSRQAEAARREGERALRAALLHDAELPEAHERLADRAHARHQALEQAGRFEEARRIEPLLVEHGRGRFATYLEGRGALTLHTDPPGAHARLYRYVERRRRLVPEFVRDLGRTPIDRVPLEQGSYRVTLSHAGRSDVHYPVFIGRLQHWDGIPPGASAPEPVPLPAALGPDEIYVPAGWFTSESENPWASHQLPRRRIWCPGFYISRFNLTVRTYAAYLDALAATGDEQALARAIPLDRGQPVMAIQDGRFGPVPDAEGDVYALDWPMIALTWHQAAAHARWRAERDGLPWRLPFELEVEKAARGVDERLYPWGNAFDPAFSKNSVNRSLPPGPAPVGSTPLDRSPYGVEELGGNVGTWTLDPYPSGSKVRDDRLALVEQPVAALMIGRGGSWTFNAKVCQANARVRLTPTMGVPHMGVRLVRPCRRE